MALESHPIPFIAFLIASQSARALNPGHGFTVPWPRCALPAADTIKLSHGQFMDRK